MGRAINKDKLIEAIAWHEQNGTISTIDDILDIIEEQPTVPQPSSEPLTGWVSVEDAGPDPGERVLATDGLFVGEAYRTSANSWHRHTGFPWRDGVTGRTVTHWMPLPTPPDRRPPEGEEET